MDLDGFWGLVEQSRDHSPDPEARLAWLHEALARRPVSDIVDFQVCQDETRRRSDTYALWGAAHQVMDGLRHQPAGQELGFRRPGRSRPPPSTPLRPLPTGPRGDEVTQHGV